MFTSALPGEGMTFCSLMCRRLRTAGHAHVLIDADLRAPSLMRLFSDPNEQPTLTACMRDPSCSRRPCSHANRNFSACMGQRTGSAN